MGSNYAGKPGTAKCTGSTILTKHEYTYDGVGNRLTHTERIGETNTPYTYAYDPLNRLLSVTGGTPESYTDDPLGNRLSKASGATTTYSQYDAANQLTQTCADSACTSVTGTFTYDLNGNLISRTDGATAYTYDAENRLLTVTNTSTVLEAYAYDHQGRRVSKHVLSQVEGTSNGTTTNYLYNGPDILGGKYVTVVVKAARERSFVLTAYLTRSIRTGVAL